MQKYFVTLLQGYPLKILLLVSFLQNQSFFSSSQNHPFQAFLVSKTYTYILHIHAKKLKIERPLTARGGGGVKALGGPPPKKGVKILLPL